MLVNTISVELTSVLFYVIRFFNLYDTVNHCKMYTIMVVFKSSFLVHIRDLD